MKYKYYLTNGKLVRVISPKNMNVWSYDAEGWLSMRVPLYYNYDVKGLTEEEAYYHIDKLLLAKKLKR